jgi:TM2 domain-containing membrane protein YozV
MRATTAERTRALEKSTIFLVCLGAWLLPGAGHFWLKQTRKGVVFMVVLLAMFLLGLALEGRIFPFEPSQPLVALAALADLGIGAIYFLAWSMGWGAGRVVAPTYEYGNTFLIVAGLLNLLVLIDAYDVALGRK